MKIVAKKRSCTKLLLYATPNISSINEIIGKIYVANKVYEKSPSESEKIYYD